jgi:NAD(P)-dependent dehydrogenase (short-subunit alcohol dehydrogenase family)/rhamnose utilization protein RhaD (predicted bifunctional aldolase and dehydrogenase)
MDSDSLAQLLEISHAIGSNSDYVQGGGGNTSVKSPDGRTMAIKASGTTLAQMSATAGWAELDLSKLLSIFDREELSSLPAREREARVLEHQAAALVPTTSGRPSVESPLHALLGRVVIHTHPVAVNALTCGPGKEVLNKFVRPGELPPLWIPYTDPGWRLATVIKSAIGTYRQTHGQPPAVILLENHGLFTSAAGARECLALHMDWIERCAKYFEAGAPAVKQVAPLDSSDLRKTMSELRRAWREAGSPSTFARWSRDPELAGLAASDTAEIMAAGAFTPDIIVYTGPRAVLIDSLRELPAKLTQALADKFPPRLAIVRNLGSFVLGHNPVELDTAEEVASSAARLARLASNHGGAHILSREGADFIINWEVEHYRAGLLQTKAAPLAGKVALVTGAGSGIGAGIAWGLVEAGAAVAFCDLDEPAAGAAAQAAPEPRRTLVVRADVTKEEQVAAAFDEVVGHWGGVDIVVCAAGISGAGELLDLPVQTWRAALELNLTGYFLVGREAARVMREQGTGGAMVIISSKSGLDASNGMSAYNATKAGELHLMRGWALELGRHGIRVNALAPGNVFEGSKLWNPDYINYRARKKGVKPEEVIPYYISLSALNREVKRSDIAAATVFLVSEAARCITGQTLVVDSGQSMVR